MAHFFPVRCSVRKRPFGELGAYEIDDRLLNGQIK
jgi:hypothetical protein